MRIGFDLQAPINKATAAIEAAKMSGNELLGHIGESSSQEEVEIWDTFKIANFGNLGYFQNRQFWPFNTTAKLQ